MTALTVAEVAQQFPPYPGYREEDWRTARDEDIESDEREKAVLEDVRLDHDGKHQRHDHPLCTHCETRRDELEAVREGYPVVRSVAEAIDKAEDRLRASGIKLAEAEPVFRELKKLWNLHYIFNKGDNESVAQKTGFDAEVVDIVADYIIDLDNVEYHKREAFETCLRRVRRYFRLHRNLPVDNFDPLDGNGLRGDILDRAELGNLPRLDPLIEDTLPQHVYGLIGGRRSTYKSYVAVDWAACIATGKQWQGRSVEQGRVLYVAGEGAYGMHARLTAWESAWRTSIEPGSFTVLRRPVNLFSNVAESDELVRVVREGAYRFVVLDTLHRMSSGADGDRTRDMGPVLDVVDRIKRATDNGSVLVIAHTEATDQKVRGSTAIEDDADVIYRTRVDNDGILRLWRDKNKDGPVEDEIPLRLSIVDLPELETTSCVLESHVEVQRIDVSDNEQHVLAAMIDAFSETGATASELREASGLPRSSFYRALNRLVRETHLVNVGTKRVPRYELSHAVQSTPDTDSRLESSESNAVQPVSQPARPSPVQSHPHKEWDVGRDGETGPLEFATQEVAS